MNRHVCIHCHFYQPPRENPWLEELELQDSAYPFHDWNERITEECYAPNTASRILDAERRIVEIVNNYAKISFNFGPTLLVWMERTHPEVYEAIIEADRLSCERFSGHGSAMAQVYNHVIMPLATTRDKQTQVIWGIRDFEYRFGRKPEGMWLAETAVDLETLEILAEHGIAFTVLAPHQAKRVRGLQEEEWKDVSGAAIDPRMPYRCKLPSGGSIGLFFYDGPASRDVAFGGLLRSGEEFASRLMGIFSKNQEVQLAHIATDGESYGHHHRFGDMALAYALHHIESNNLARITNYGEYLEKFPPVHEVEIFENTSWSCAHGVERWRSDCGCSTGMHAGWNQAWRAPLREAMDWLGGALEGLYEREIASYVHHPWQARDDYIEVVLDRTDQVVDRFLSGHSTREVSGQDRVKVLKLLEMQRHAMLMFTSCAWFFDEISGIETVQVMQYASRAMQLAREVSGEELEPRYLEILRQAPSNASEFKNGEEVWNALVRPATIDLLRAGAHYAISSLFEEYPEKVQMFSYTTRSEIYEVEEAGIQRLALGKAVVRSDITGDEQDMGFAVLHLGDHNLIGGVREYMGDEAFYSMCEEIKKSFERSDIAEIIRLMDAYFKTHNYSLWHLFRDEQRKVLDKILESTLSEIEASFRQIYERHYPVMQVMKEMRIPLPKAFSAATELIIGTDMRQELQREELDFEEIGRLVEEVKRWSLELDRKSLGFVVSRKITALMQGLSEEPKRVAPLTTVERIFGVLGDLNLEMDLWAAQNIFFSIGKEHYDAMEERASQGDEAAREWLEHFNRVGENLHIVST
jgi:alpha-amylase/alpha-mannosidase (GH57 family)